MSNSKIDTVLVLGMHRSGTSCLTGALSKLGLYAGPISTSFSGNHHNPKGYFEDQKVVDCNNNILVNAISNQLPINKQKIIDINDLFLSEFAWSLGALCQYSNKNKEHEDEVRTTLNNYVHLKPDNSDIVLKDPRLCLTLPHWKPFLNLKAVLIMVRSPDEVAESLYKRDHFELSLSLSLWKYYIESSLANTSELPVKFITYTQLINNTKSAMDDICSFLKSRKVKLYGSFTEAVEFIQPKLNRFTSGLPLDSADQYLSVYKAIVENENHTEISKIIGELTTEHWETIFYRTYQAYSITSCKNENTKIKYHCQLEFERINKHPISGPVLKLLRFLKKDKSFAKYPK